MTINTRFRRHHIGLIALLGAAALTGCSSVPEPVGELASARTAIRSTEGSGASTLAPVELDRAQTKLTRAETAAADKKYDVARRLAEEATADADLAAAKANAVKAERGADELEKSISVLRSEIDRAGTTR